MLAWGWSLRPLSSLPFICRSFIPFRRTANGGETGGTDWTNVATAETFGLEYSHKFGCDAAVEFHPHRLAVPEISERVFEAEHEERFKGAVFDYRNVVRNEMLNLIYSP